MNKEGKVSEIAAEARKTSAWTTVLSILVILLGLGAIIVPEIAGLAVTLLVGWALLIAGGFEIMHAVGVRGSRFVLHFLIGILDVVVGFYVILHPGAGLLTLTLFLAVIFVVDGVFTLAWGFRLRPHAGSGWLLFDGAISLVLGILIWAHWPYSSVWFIGTLIGIRLMMEGFGRLMAPSVTRTLAI
jgi:uncharacterized membrane protein HdeD (DUF308 family)